jgi:uncharacterized damage-inducible protein DinB
MRLKSLILACCLLLSGGSSLAQSGGADPIAGAWTGDIGLTTTNRMPIKSEPFRITRGAAAAFAPRPAGSDAASELRRSFGEVSGNVTKAAELVPADKYTYRPAASVRTFGQLIAHIADSYNYYCANAAGRSVEWSDPIEKGSTTKAVLTARLKQSLETCTAAYAATGKAGALIDNIAHTNLHYGNIITYMRMLGLVPPSS